MYKENMKLGGRDDGGPGRNWKGVERVDCDRDNFVDV